MSMYAFFTQGLQRLARENWGTKIADGEGNRKDTGVQPFVDELLAALSSDRKSVV